MSLRIIEGKDPYYTFIRTIGSGGFGTVSLVKRNNDGKIMACKAIDCSAHPQVREYAEKEIRTLVKLGSSDWIASFSNDCSWNSSSQTLRLYMDYYVGGDLQNLLDELRHQETRLDPIIAWYIAVGIINGVETCHDAGVIHRDLKPANILLERNIVAENECLRAASSRTPWTQEQKDKWNKWSTPGNEFTDKQVKITDFGLSKFVEGSRSTRATFSLMGTPGYIAPETQGASGTFSKKSDIFSLGHVLYVLFSGKNLHSQAPLRSSLSGLPEEYGPGVRSLIERCLSTSPSQRPSAHEVAKEAGDLFKAFTESDYLKYTSVFIVKQLAEPVQSTPTPRATPAVKEAKWLVVGREMGKIVQRGQVMKTIADEMKDLLR